MSFITRNTMKWANLGVLALVPGFADTAFAHAQPVATGGAVAENEHAKEGVPDIVVTAQRRQENLQKTPIAVIAVTGSQLQAQGVVDAKSLQNLVPGLSANDQGQVFLRGVGTSQTNEIADPSVATNLDGVYVARPQALAAAGYFDVSRVEVLKGPQGTLYGRNTTGGVVNVISNEPRDQFAGAASVQYGSYNELATSGMLNVPVDDRLAVRAAFQTVRHDGYLPSTTSTRPAEDSADSKALRLTALYKATDNLAITLSGDYLADNSLRGLYGQTIRSIQPGALYTAHNTLAADPAMNTSQYGGARAQIDWHVGPGHLIYVGAYRVSDYKYQDDYFWGYAASGATQGASSVSLHSATNQQELRYTADVGALKFTVGGFYYTEKARETAIFTNPPIAYLYSYPSISEDSKAVFGQGTYALTSRLRVTAGLRWTRDTKGRDGAFYLGSGTQLNGMVYPSTPSSLFQAQYSWSKATWKAGIDFDLTAGSLLFANVSTGFKAGGYNDGVQGAGAAAPYRPETLTAYEIGSKNRFLDNRLQLNIDAYYYDYSDLQEQAFITLSNGLTTTLNTNATKAKIYGLDAEVIARPTRDDQFDGGLSLLHAHYGS